jgi:ribosomal protein L37E
MNNKQLNSTLHFVYGDLLKSSADYIAHQANCRGVMSAGLAKQLRAAYPEMYNLYKKHCTTYKPADLLGKAFIYNKVITIFGQLNFGREPIVYTDYNALRRAFTAIHKRLPLDKSIAFPYGFGCGLAHGAWIIVKRLIQECFPERDIYIVCNDATPRGLGLIKHNKFTTVDDCCPDCGAPASVYDKKHGCSNCGYGYPNHESPKANAWDSDARAHMSADEIYCNSFTKVENLATALECDYNTAFDIVYNSAVIYDENETDDAL